MNHGANLTLMEMDTKSKSAQMIAQAKRARRRQVVGPQTGEQPAMHRNVVTRFTAKHTLEMAASLLAVVVIGGGITSAVIVA